MMRHKVLGAVVIAAVLIACGAPTIGPMFEDAGNALVDVGQMIDGSDDAAAQTDRVIEVACDGTGTRTITRLDGSTTSSTTYYAVLTDPSISVDTPDIIATVCDRSAVGTDPDACPSGVSCHDTHPMPLPCITVSVEVAVGQARVSCGSSVLSDPDGSGSMPASESGVRYDHARFVLR